METTHSTYPWPRIGEAKQPGSHKNHPFENIQEYKYKMENCEIRDKEIKGMLLSRPSITETQKKTVQ